MQEKSATRKLPASGKIVVLAIFLSIIISISGYFGAPFNWSRIYYYVGLNRAAPPYVSYVSFINAGQGNATLIFSGDRAMLIDAGDFGASIPVVNYLRTNGIERLCYVVMSHPHADHTGGIAAVLQEFNVDKLLLDPTIPQWERDRFLFENILGTANEQNVEIIEFDYRTTLNYIINIGSFTLQIIGPTTRHLRENDNSIVIMAEAYGTRFLFTGDIERYGEAYLALRYRDSLQADILQVAHHGSNSSSTDIFLRNVNPSIAVISAGQRNLFNHPRDEVIERLRMAGAQIYRTDVNGNIRFTSFGGGPFVVSAQHN